MQANRIIRLTRYDKAQDLLSDLIKGKTSISPGELETIADRLECNHNDIINGSLWLLAIYGMAQPRLLQLAKKLVNSWDSLSDQKIYDYSLPKALTYLLHKSRSNKALIKKFSRARSPILQYALADYLIEKGMQEQGLWLMLDIYPKVDTDHTTGDGIILTYNQFGSPDFKIKLLAEAAKCESKGEVERSRAAYWLASCIPDVN